MDRPVPGLPGTGLIPVRTDSRVEVLGIRHHGPGSARSVAAALDELDADLVLIEGAPELDGLLALAADPELTPPVAGLVYVVDEPGRAVFYPLAVFSPEWVALRWALTRDVGVRFADLPAAHALAMDDAEDPSPDTDPLGELARAAGYDDAERWWEDVIEHRDASTLDRFATVREAMTEVRRDNGSERDRRREAYMRKVIRAGIRGGAKRIAVVCGAYHAPVLHPSTFPTVSADNALLAGLPKRRVAVTLAPWSAGRLATTSGYGAGVTSPGWYRHLFVCQSENRSDEIVPDWLVRVARALRDERIDASTASVVEASRLAETLAVIRGRPSVGLTELRDASQAVLCDGSELPLRLIEQRLVIGEELGRVPEATPMVPLAADLADQQKSLRLTPTAAAVTLTVDLRRDSQRARSVLLHRLRLLGVPWGEPSGTARGSGTFKEVWELRWEPELAVAVIEAGRHGTTVVSAADNKVATLARECADLTELSDLVERCLIADLPNGLAAVVTALAERTAVHHDVLALLGTIEPLARTCRYGDVRKVDTTAVGEVLRTVVIRVSIGLRAACATLDDNAAEAMRAAVESAHRGISLVDVEGRQWTNALVTVAGQDSTHGSVSGRVNRLLLDAGVIDTEEAGRRLARRLSVGAPAVTAAAWLDGFLAGEALLLLHDRDLLSTVDDWISTISEETFEDLLPLLRRTFSRHTPPERRQIGTTVRNLDATDNHDEPPPDLDRAAPAVRRVAALLGMEVTR